MGALTLFILILAITWNPFSVQGTICSGTGTAEGSYCNCYAGSAPIYSEGVDNCDDSVSGCTGPADDPLTSGNYLPLVNPVSFSNDRITMQFTQPTVQQPWYRREAYISFYFGASAEDGVATSGSSSCSYPGSMWIKSLSGCTDTYTFNMPWSSYSRCGFQRAATSSTITYTTTVKFTYNLYDGVSPSVAREVSNLYKFTVQFARQTQISSSLNLMLTSPSDTTVRAVVVGGSAYDLLSGQINAVFQTQTSWPYQVASSITSPTSSDPTPISFPENTEVMVKPDYYFPSDCPITSDSTCYQQFVVTITPTSSICDLHGDYVFSTQLVCADVTTCTPKSGPNVTISLDHHDICSPASVDTGKLVTQSLLSFSDREFSIPRSDFETGDQSFWTFTIVDPSVSIDSLTLNTVELSLLSSPGTDVIYSAGSSQSKAIKHIVEPKSGVVYPPGTPIVITFELVLSRGYLPNTISTLAPIGSETPGDFMATMNLVVSVDISYHGNKQRSIGVIVSPGNNGEASSVSSFVVRASSTEKTLVSHASKREVEPKASPVVMRDSGSENSNCTGPNFLSCLVVSFVRDVLKLIGF